MENEIIIDKKRQHITKVECYSDIVEMIDRIVHNMEFEDPTEESSAMLKTQIDLLNLRSKIQELDFEEFREYNR